MLIQRWTGPPVDTHTYLLIDPASAEAWAIDAPLETATAVRRYVEKEGLRLTRLILTHGHFDHILDAGEYQKAGIPVHLHPDERPLLSAPQTALFGLPFEMPSVAVDEALTEGDVLRLGEDAWQVWHVPGHSPGHILLYCPEQATLFGGDLLFQGGYGRIDFPGCDALAMAESLARLLELPAQTRVYPGHGPDTTVGAEQPWLEPMLRTGFG
jgi:hydroxyacylglutathione hydrolase